MSDKFSDAGSTVARFITDSYDYTSENQVNQQINSIAKTKNLLKSNELGAYHQPMETLLNLDDVDDDDD